MDTIQLSIDVDEYKRKLSINLFGLRELTSGGHFGSNPPLIFLDTNILLWLYRINNAARAEILYFFHELKKNNRLFIPSWVVHEYNHHIQKREDNTLFPFKKPANEIKTRLQSIEKYSKLIVDDKYIQGTGYESGNAFLDELDKTTKKFEKLLKTLTNSRNTNIDSIQMEIERLINECILDSDLNSLMDNAKKSAEIRIENRVPPGFLDAKKQENKYGDYILWQEIILECKIKKCSGILISNDIKLDWLYSPKYILGKVPNNGTKDIKIFLPHPFLSTEFKQTVGNSSEFIPVNIELLSHLCSSVKHNPQSHHEYKNLAKAVAIESSSCDTYSVISWFLQNEDKYTDAIHGVASYMQSPGEINEDDLKEYIEQNIPNIDSSKIKLQEIICEIFI